MDLGDMKSRELGNLNTKTLVEMGKDILEKADDSMDEMKERLLEKADAGIGEMKEKLRNGRKK